MAKIVEKKESEKAKTRARETRSGSRVCDATGKKQIHRGLKKAGVFQKEGTFFRKKDFKTLIDCRLRFIRFHLTEIRIDGKVKNKAVF